MLEVRLQVAFDLKMWVFVEKMFNFALKLQPCAVKNL